jgi:hypothetical protein
MILALITGLYKSESIPENCRYSIKVSGNISKFIDLPLRVVAISELNRCALEPVIKIFWEIES